MAARDVTPDHDGCKEHEGDDDWHGSVDDAEDEEARAHELAEAHKALAVVSVRFHILRFFPNLQGNLADFKINFFN